MLPGLRVALPGGEGRSGVGDVGSEGDSVGDADGDGRGGQRVITALRNEDAVFSEVPALVLEVDFGLEVADEVDVDASTEGVGETTVFVVAGAGIDGVDDAADAGEEVDVGMEGVEVRLGAEASEDGAFGDGGAGGVAATKLKRRSDGQAEVAGDVYAGGDALIVALAEVGSDVGVASEGGDVHALGFGGGVLCVHCLRAGQGKDTKADRENRER
jgi:hypothetical protein